MYAYVEAVSCVVEVDSDTCNEGSRRGVRNIDIVGRKGVVEVLYAIEGPTAYVKETASGDLFG